MSDYFDTEKLSVWFYDGKVYLELEQEVVTLTVEEARDLAKWILGHEAKP